MIRFRWTDPKPDDPSTPVDWRSAALITATLFLNFVWYRLGSVLPMYCPLPLYAGIVAAGSLLMTFFFVGPALLTQVSRRPLLGAVENSLGSIPALGFRLGCVLFLVLWIENVVRVPGWFLLRDSSRLTQFGAIAGLLVFLFVTALQSLRTNGKLAVFTNKLAIAILVAALVRVRDGWPSALSGFPPQGHNTVSDLGHGLSLLAFYVAPLALLAANFGHRSQGRKKVAMTALMGFAVPVFGTLLVIGVIDVATYASSFYQPSLNPDVVMALFGHAARMSLPGPMMIVAITEFGAVRFGARALSESLSIRSLGKRLRWCLLACLIGVIAWLFHGSAPDLSKAGDVSGRLLAVVGAVLTADFVTGRWQIERVRRIDWVGTVAVLAGMATPWYLGRWMAADSEWFHGSLLPSYGVGFLVCLCGGAVQKMLIGRRVQAG